MAATAAPMGGIGASPGFNQGSLSSSTGYQQQRVGSPSMVDRFVKSLARNAVTHPSQGGRGHRRGASDSRTPYYSSGGSLSSSTSSVNEPVTSNSKLRARVLAHDGELRSQAATRQRSRTETNRTSASTYGGIGESPVARSRQNSSSSSRSTNVAASIFSHRPSTSSATRETAQAGQHSRDATAASSAGPTNIKNSTMPSIRGFTDLQGPRPRTPLLEPFQRDRMHTVAGSSAPRIDTQQPESYVASLGLAPLVAYPPIERSPRSPPAEASITASPRVDTNHVSTHVPSATRRRSPSVDSYLETSPTQFASFQRGQAESKRTRKGSRRARSRKGSMSTVNQSEGEQSLGSRFVRYDSRPMPSAHSTYRFGIPGQGQLPAQPLDSGRRSRSRSRDHTRGSSADKRSEETRQYRKLISARLPNNGDRSHWHHRIPSQPLGLTWVCGARSAARHPSFYDEFEYSSYPYGRRKRSLSRSTLNTPAMSSADANTAYRSPLHYESEPETISRGVARRQSMREASQTGQSNRIPEQDEYHLRRRSRSLVNLRQAAEEGRTGLLISSPLAMPRVHGDDMSRPPRRAPIPDMDIAGPPASSRIPTRSTFDDIVNPQERREALFAALPPPARRSTTPNMSPNMYTTGRLIASTVRRTTEEDDPRVQAEGNGTRSPALNDLGDYEASRVIIGEDYLPNIASVSAQERYPVIYGRAFSTGDDHTGIAQSHEGEIIEYQSDNRHTLGSDYSPGIDAYLANHTSKENRGDLLGPSESASRSGSGSGTASSIVPSVANSAHVLDLRDENFQNLFYAAPPASKALPDLPSSRNSPEISLYNRHRISDVPSEFIARGITDTPPLDSPQLDRQTGLLAFSPREEAGENETSEVLDMDQVLVPLGSTSLASPASDTLLARTVIEPVTARNEDDSRPFLRGISTGSSSEDGSVSYATASANASSSVLDLRPHRQVHHQASFQSARSQFTESSVARTVQGNFTPATERDQAFYTANTERADPLEDSLQAINQSLANMHVFPAEHGRDSYIDFEAEPHPRDRRDSLAQASNYSFIDDNSDDEAENGTKVEGHLLTASSASHYPPSPDVVIQAPGNAEEATMTFDARQSPLPSEPITPTDPSRYSSSSADLLDVYDRGSRQPGRDSQASFNLDVPFTARQERNSSASHTHSVSNASLLSHLDSFPEPPPTSATERANPMDAAGLALVDRSESKSTLRPPRRSSLPPSMHQPSKTTLASGSTSVYTFTSYPDEEALSPTAAQSSSRSSFLDLSTSPERPSSSGPQLYLNFATTEAPTPRMNSYERATMQQH